MDKKIESLWIPNLTGSFPILDKNQYVSAVLFRNGVTVVPTNPEECRWTCAGLNGDITHYKTAQLTPVSSPTFSIEQFKKFCLEDYFRGEPCDADGFVSYFTKWLAKEKLKQDPEYDKYLELKKKFGE